MVTTQKVVFSRVFLFNGMAFFILFHIAYLHIWGYVFAKGTQNTAIRHGVPVSIPPYMEMRLIELESAVLRRLLPGQREQSVVLATKLGRHKEGNPAFKGVLLEIKVIQTFTRHHVPHR